MSRVTVSEDKSTFCRDKKPFFYLADTIWSAFTNITEDEWIYYLKRRKEQGAVSYTHLTLPTIYSV